jgi:CO/xanthine dehydrogenase FAD-binding subunit
MNRSSYRPKSLEEALSIRSRSGALPFAGGTDLMVRHRGYTGTGHRIPAELLFLDRVPELNGIRREGRELVIGAALPINDIIRHPDCPQPLTRALELHAAWAIRNRASLGGNIANASPAADSVPPLMVLDARLTLVSAGGSRTLEVADFATGPGRSVLADDEIIAEIRIPLPDADGEPADYYRKAGTRRANALSRVSLAGLARIGSGGTGGAAPTDFRFAFGAVAPTVIRIPELEAAVVAGAGIREARRIAEPHIVPIDDQRSTAAYRKAVALNGLEEFLRTLGVTE